MGKKLVNSHITKIYRRWWHYILWRLGYYKDRQEYQSVPDNFCYPSFDASINEAQPIVTWVNHYTFWIRSGKKSVLVDPIWNQRCSPLSFLGPKRHHAAIPNLESITKLDAVVITHNHYDHLDKFTVKKIGQLHPNAIWIVPLGVNRWFKRLFPSYRVHELNWWGTYCDAGLTFTATPAQHFSGRNLLDSNKSLWMGCVVEFEKGKRVYIAGDTGYNGVDFKQIGEKFSKIDLSLIPIGVYLPRPFMRAVHVNPDEAVQIHKDVGSQLSIAGHWKTFHLSDEQIERPPFDLYCSLKERQIPFEKFRALTPGESVNW